MYCFELACIFFGLTYINGSFKAGLLSVTRVNFLMQILRSERRYSRPWSRLPVWCLVSKTDLLDN